MSNREDILNKVRALLSKTVDNGCTEAEAMAALEMAGKLMDNHDISEDDIKEVQDEAAVIDSMFCDRDPHAISWKLAYWISKFTESYVYGHNKKINFVGLKTDTEFAIWLTQTLTRFVQAELKKFMWQHGYQSLDSARKRRVINGFVAGCCGTINVKLKKMIDARQIVVNSTALVVAKDALIQDAIKDLNIGKADNRGRKARMYHNAFSAGVNAGDEATFGRPVESGGGLLRLK